MGTDVTGDDPIYTGLLVPMTLNSNDARWTAEESITEASPRPGVPEPQNDSGVVLQSSGTQSSGTLEVRAQAGGMPGFEKGGFVWRDLNDTLWRGWDSPAHIAAWQSVVWTSASLLKAVEPHALSLPSGVVLVAYRHQDTSGSPHGVKVASVATDGTVTNVTVYNQSSAPSSVFSPTLVRLRDGRICLFHYVTTSATEQVRMHYSTDDGATWAVGSTYALQTSPAISDARHLRAITDGSTILLLGSSRGGTTNDGDLMQQWVSTDLGTSFERIYETSASSTDPLDYSAAADGAAIGGAWVVVYVSGDAKVAYAVLSSPFDSFGDSTRATTSSTPTYSGNEVSGTPDVVNNANIALVKLEDDALYLYATDVTNTRSWCQRGELSGGDVTWNRSGRQTGFTGDHSLWWRNITGGASWPAQICGVLNRGRVLIFSPDGSNLHTANNDLSVYALGGYGNVSMPEVTNTGAQFRTNRALWTYNYVPSQSPSNSGWTATGAGTGSQGTGAWNVSTSSNTRYFSYAPSTTVDQGLIVRFSLTVNSGGSTSNQAVGFTLQVADGSDDYGVHFRFSTTAFAVHDLNGSQVDSDVSIDMTAGIDIIAAIAKTATNTGAFRCWYRARSYSADREYTAGPDSDALTNGATASADLIRFGNITSATADSDWHEVHLTAGADTGDGLHSGQTNPTDLAVRDFSIAPVALAGGVSIAAIDGPAFQGDEWHIETRHDYEVENVFPDIQASPRVAWRSTGTAQTDIAFAFDSTLLGTVESKTESDLIGVCLMGINFKTAELHGYDTGTSAWVKIDDIDAADNLDGLRWTRTGVTVHPDTGSASSNSPFMPPNEFKGCTFDLDGDLRKISRHTGGLYTNATARRPVFVLDGITNSEATSGTAGAIWACNVTRIISLRGATYAGFMLRITSHSTADGYFEIGSLLIGNVYAFSIPYSFGHSVSTEPAVTIHETPDRMTRSRVDAPHRRIFTLDWTDPVSMTETQGQSPDPRYWKGESNASAEPIASIGDVPHFVEGVSRLLDGPHTHVALLRDLSFSEKQTLNRRHRHAFCRAFTTDIVNTTVRGSENRDELVRGPRLVLQEEV